MWWKSSCWMNSTYPYLSPRSATPCVVKGGQRRRLDKKSRERNADSRDDYCYLISEFCSYHLVYVDESECDKRIGFRRTGWSPLGKALVQVSKSNRDQQCQILPAYLSTFLLQESVHVSIDSTISTLWPIPDLISYLNDRCSTPYK